MRVIEKSEYKDESGTISLENRVRATLKYGLRWYADMQAQDLVTQMLGKMLGDEYVLLRNLPLPGEAAPVPLILIGPQGVRALMATPIRGNFRAKVDQWLTFDGQARRFKRARPNLQSIALSLAQTVLSVIKSQGYDLPEVEAVLVFTNPRTLVDTARPTVRIVLADAIDHFAANVLQFPAIMDAEDVNILLEALTHPRPPEQQAAGPAGEVQPFSPAAAVRPGPQPAAPYPTPAPRATPFPTPPPSPRGMPYPTPSVTPRSPAASAFDDEAPLEPATWFPGTPRPQAAQAAPTPAPLPAGPRDIEAMADAALKPLERRLTSVRAPSGLRFTTMQWAILGGLLLFEIIIITALAFLVLGESLMP